MTVFVHRHCLIKINNEEYLIINGLTGAIDILSPLEVEQIKQFQDNLDVNILNKELYHQLLERGYLLDAEDREKQLLKEIENRITQSSQYAKAIGALVLPTYACNLRCTYCYEGNIKEMKQRLDTTKIENIINFYDYLIKKSNTTIEEIQTSFYGGEPFLPGNMPIVFKIMEQLRSHYPDKRVIFSAITNGTHLERFAEQLKKHGLISVQVTLDGPQYIHDQRRPYANGKGSYEDIVHGISVCLKQGIKVNLRINIDLENMHTLPNLAFQLKKLWGNSLKTGELAPYVGLVEEPSCPGHQPAVRHINEVLDYLLEMIDTSPDVFKTINFNMGILSFLQNAINNGQLIAPKIFYCGAHTTTWALGSEGLIYTCWGVVGDKNQAVGTYYPELEMWQKPLERWHSRSVLKMNKCQDCALGLICAGGCAHRSLNACGDMFEPYCQDIDALEKSLNLTFRLREVLQQEKYHKN